MTHESDIVHEHGDYFVLRNHGIYTVYLGGAVTACADSSYAGTPDGLSIAIARCNYLAMRGARA
jgi:hypothetical protein